MRLHKDLVEKYLHEIDYIDLEPAKKNINNVLQNITTMEDWLNMAKALVIRGKRDDALKVSKALVKKADILYRLTKAIPTIKITNKIARRTKLV